jgi:hypothetical protein
MGAWQLGDVDVKISLYVSAHLGHMQLLLHKIENWNWPSLTHLDMLLD